MGSLSGRDIGIDPFVYSLGSGPDTILYFGRSKLPAYLEINKDGRLNLKVNLEDLARKEEEEKRINKARTYYQDLLEEHTPQLTTKKLNPKHNSKTIMWFDVGHVPQNGNLFYSSTKANIIDRLSKILKTFYGSPLFAQMDMDPSTHPPHF